MDSLTQLALGAAVAATVMGKTPGSRLKTVLTGAVLGTREPWEGAALTPGGAFDGGKTLGLDREVWGVTGLARLDHPLRQRGADAGGGRADHSRGHHRAAPGGRGHGDRATPRRGVRAVVQPHRHDPHLQ